MSGWLIRVYVYLWHSQVLKFPLPLCALGWCTSRRDRPVGHGWFEGARSLLQRSSFRVWDFGDSATRKSGLRERPSADSSFGTLNSSSGQNLSTKVVRSREVSHLFPFDPTPRSNTSGRILDTGVCAAHGCPPAGYTR